MQRISSAWHATRWEHGEEMSVDPRAGVVRESCETWQVENLFVADGSVLPTSIGVNSQLPIMGVAHKIASGIAAEWPRLARRAA